MLGKALTTAAAGNAAGEVLGVEDVFSTWLYTGNGSTQTITNGIDLAGEGGLVWIKDRSQIADHVIYDTSTGRSSFRFSNRTDADVSNTDPGEGLTTFNVDGFSLGFNRWEENLNSRNYASWTFRKAPGFFDVVTYVGDGTNRTIPHNLGSIPGCIIVKKTSSTGNWAVYHRSLTSAEYFLTLNTTNGQFSDSTRWNSTAPTSTVFSLGTDGDVNASGETYVAYLFAHDAGGFGDDGTESVIKCGSFTASSGTATVSLGWEPQWIMLKKTNSTGNWLVWDTLRGWNNGGNTFTLNPNTSAAEDTTTPYSTISATGFSAQYLGGNDTYIYIAIRRGPMKTPTDATTVFKAVAQTSQGTVSTDFPVDMVIMGDRSSTWGYNWSTQDRLRGKSAVLFTSATTAENTTSLSTFDSNTSFKDGWVSGGTSAIYETFRRAPGFFDAVAYTGTGSNRSLNHNLGVTPELMIAKKRSGADNWPVYSATLGTGVAAGMRLNEVDSAGYNNGTRFYQTPTASLFYIGTDTDINASGQTYIAYLFASCSGVSKVGSYTGTGTTLNIDCGFTSGARFVLIKRTDNTGDWYVFDTARGITSSASPYLLLNSTAAEVTGIDYIDPLSSGFQITSTAPAAINASGGSFIFLAVA